MRLIHVRVTAGVSKATYGGAEGQGGRRATGERRMGKADAAMKLQRSACRLMDDGWMMIPTRSPLSPDSDSSWDTRHVTGSFSKAHPDWTEEPSPLPGLCSGHNPLAANSIGTSRRLNPVPDGRIAHQRIISPVSHISHISHISPTESIE